MAPVFAALLPSPAALQQPPELHRSSPRCWGCLPKERGCHWRMNRLLSPHPFSPHFLVFSPLGEKQTLGERLLADNNHLSSCCSQLCLMAACRRAGRERAGPGGPQGERPGGAWRGCSSWETPYFSSRLAVVPSPFLPLFLFFFLPPNVTLSAVSYSLPPPESLCTQQHLGILCSTARFPFQSHTALLAVTCSRREVLFPRPGCRLAALGPVSGAGINLCM